MNAPIDNEDRRQRADESVARSFTRVMRAAVSPVGVLTDPPLVGVAEAIAVVLAIVLYQSGVRAEALLGALVAMPLVVAVAVSAGLAGARRKVVGWLASVPFPVENVNALLNGVGQNLLVRFRGAPPDRDALNAELEKIHPDCFALEFHEEEPEVEVRIGVLDSKYNPAGATYRRYRRVQQLVDGCLVPLAAAHPIESVRVC